MAHDNAKTAASNPVPTVDAEGDVYILSFPKCGRTWLRLLLARAISAAHGVPMEVCRDLDLTHFSAVDSSVPRIVFWHDDRVGLRAPAQLSADKNFYRDRRVVLLLRDIRDVAVSHYFQRTRREGDSYNGTLGDFLSEEVGSVRTCLEFWNIWHAQQHVPADFLLTSYERLTADTPGELSRIMRFCGLTQAVDPAAVETAVAFARFGAMRAMERDDVFRSEKLRPSDPGDVESYKTRRGVVGGFRDYLTEEQADDVGALVRGHLVPAWQPAALAADEQQGSPLSTAK